MAKMTEADIEAIFDEAYDRAGIGFSGRLDGSEIADPAVLISDGLDGNGVYAIIPSGADVADVTLGKNVVTLTDRLGRARRIAGRSRQHCRIWKLTHSAGWVLVHEVRADKPMPWHNANGVQRPHKRQWTKYLRAALALRGKVRGE